ncbi:MAG: nuclear transport factor 2 family protein [Acidobacteriia bacterium]|nr:nuclear transport factor 2 family protein [Terriglobia bacterium]
MKRLLASVFAIGIACAGAVAALTAGPVAAPDDMEAVREADRAFEQAVGIADKKIAKAAVGKFLDAEFTWTDAAGKTSARAQVLRSFDAGKGPEFATGGESARVREYTYGQVAVVQKDAGKVHILRVWVKRPAGWRALVYQEVKSLDAPPTFAPGAGRACENPCKSVPYHPKNETEKAVIASYLGLESAAVAHNASDFGTHVADEFAAASSNSDVLLDKAERMAGLEREKMAGVSPTPLVSARMFDFGDAVVMLSLHQPDRGKPLHITRVWIARDGKWVETLSYQTAIQEAPAAISK